MSHWNKHKVVILLKLNILDIRFTKNEYFLKNSRYTIFQKNKTTNRIKSLRNVKESKDLIRIPIEESLIIRATLFQEKALKDTNNFLPKSRKIVVRQLSKLKGDTVYRDIGCIEMKLNEIVKSSKIKDYEFELIDNDGHAEATIRANIEWDYLDQVAQKSTLPRRKFFGLCKGDPTEVKGDQKATSEFFNNLRVRFNSTGDDDIADIPQNASVYGDLNQSYSNLLESTKNDGSPEPKIQETQKAVDNEEIVLPSDVGNAEVVTEAQSPKSLQNRPLPAVQSADSFNNFTEDDDEEVRFREKERKSKAIARKLRKLCSTGRNESSGPKADPLIMKARGQVLYLCSDDESGTDQDNDDASSEGVGDLVRESVQILSAPGQLRSSNRSSANIDMSLPAFSQEETGKYRDADDEANFSYRISSSSHTRTSLPRVQSTSSRPQVDDSEELTLTSGMVGDSPRASVSNNRHSRYVSVSRVYNQQRNRNKLGGERLSQEKYFTENNFYLDRNKDKSANASRSQQQHHLYQ